MKPWDPRDARDYYLGAAVYAWLFLFGEAKDAPPGAFDRRFREACDLYNYGLGLGLTERRSTNGVVQLQNARRRLPVGEIELQLDRTHFPPAVGRVRGDSARGSIPRARSECAQSRARRRRAA